MAGSNSKTEHELAVAHDADVCTHRLTSLEQKIDSTFTAVTLTSIHNTKESEGNVRRLVEELEGRQQKHFEELTRKHQEEISELKSTVTELKLLVAGLVDKGQGSVLATNDDKKATGEPKPPGPIPSKAATVEDDSSDGAETAHSTGSKPAVAPVESTRSPVTSKAEDKKPTETKAAKQKRALVDYIRLEPFTYGAAFERWTAQMDLLWYGDADETYRAALLENLRTDTHQPVANWVKRCTSEFMHQASWPDIKGSMRELFMPSVGTVDDYRKWAETMKEVAPDYFQDPFACGHDNCLCYWAADVVAESMGLLGLSPSGSLGCSSSNTGPSSTSWGSSLSTGNLAGAFKSPSATGSSGAGTAPVSRSADDGDSGKPPPPSYQAAVNQPASASPSTSASGSRHPGATATLGLSGITVKKSVLTGLNGAAGTSTPKKTASSSDKGKTPSHTLTGKGTSVNPATSSGHGATSSKATTAGASSSKLPTSTGRVSNSTGPSSKASFVEPMIKTLEKYNGNASGFHDWTKQVDGLWYAFNDDEFHKTFLFALSKTLSGRAAEWVSSREKDWLEYSTWNDWKASLGEWVGGEAMYDLREEPSALILRPQPLRLFQRPTNPVVYLDQIPASKRRFK